LSPGADVTITYIDMQSSTVGWALGGSSDPGDHVLRSSDGGQTWSDVTPPEPAPTGAEPDKVAHAFFFDEDTAWVTYAYDVMFTIPEYPLVWYTHDGGQTWEHSAYLDTRASLDFYSPGYLQFSDENHGWLLVAVGAGMSHSYSLLFRTTDGGATWQRIIDPHSSVDLHNCCKTGMLFYDEDNGLVTSEQGPYTEPFLIWSEDSGETWTQTPLPAPISNPDLFLNAFCNVHSPHWFSSSDVLVGLSCKDFSGSGDPTIHTFVYTSLDRGATWSTSEIDAEGPLIFFDLQTGFALGRDLMATTDGGLTWGPIKEVFWDGQFSFVTRDLGWAVARDGDEIAFLSTDDGGETWQAIEAVIGP
ncbi:MAG: hypothetical protein OEV06_06465, partial [Anaerolineae bacterium]|nr:hypothetical protein [Anaerolineae bacterium]